MEDLWGTGMKSIRKTATIFYVFILCCIILPLCVQAGSPDSATGDAGTVKTGRRQAPENPAPFFSGQPSITRLAVAEKEIEHLLETVSRMEQKVNKRQEKIDSLWVVQLANFLSLDKIIGILLSLFGVVGWLFWAYMPKKIREKFNKEKWAEATIDAALLPEREQLTRLIEEQVKENRRRILARDIKIHILASETNLSEEEGQHLDRFKKFLSYFGFQNITSSIDEAELLVLFGKETCERKWKEVSSQLRGKLIPVILYTDQRLNPTIPKQFDVATFANTLPTAIIHLHNFAMLTAKVENERYPS